jgi:hypothetical protein
MRTTLFIQRLSGVAMLGLVGLTFTSCGEVARTGRSPAFLIIDSIEGSSGAEPGTFSSVLLSDVETVIESTVNGQTVRNPTIFNDLGRVAFRMGLKNPGSAGSPVTPTTLNEITLTRYRVTFQRADGRNTPGTEVPYGFDGAFTLTVPAGGSASTTFDIVRHQNKSEPPLSNMARRGGAQLVSTIAEITFFGRDQAGNEVSATGHLQVNFGDFADPN